MGIFDYITQQSKNRSLLVQLTRSDHYKLQMICDDLNENVEMDFEITPEFIASKILKTFIDQSYNDATQKMTRCLMPEFQSEQTRRLRKTNGTR
jgi:hypothetical protein